MRLAGGGAIQLGVLVLCVASSVAPIAEQTTFAQHAPPLVTKSCEPCRRPGEIADCRIKITNVDQYSDSREIKEAFDTLSSAALRFLNASLDFVGWIPRDPQLLRAVARARTVVVDAADCPSAQAFTELAKRFLHLAGRARVKGNVQFFFRRMLEGGTIQS